MESGGTERKRPRRGGRGGPRAGPVEVRAVGTAAEHAVFRRLPKRLHRGDPDFVHVPDAVERARFDPKHPYFEHAEAELFLARDGRGRAVGRISAQIDRLERADEGGAGHFGFFEAASGEAGAALLARAEDWLRGRGVRRVTGPFSFSVNQESGLLLGGAPGPPSLMMNYAPTWYAEVLRAAGYELCRELLAYELDMRGGVSEGGEKLAGKAAGEGRLSERPLRPDALEAEVARLVGLYNAAWAGNWGFVPMTEAEGRAFGAQIGALLRPELVRFARMDGRDVGMILVLPDVNEAWRGLRMGWNPLDWARFLWRFKVAGLSRCRVALMGVDPGLRGAGRAAVAALLMVRAFEAARRRGFRRLEMSWILEDNRAMRGLAELCGARVTRRYGVFGKDLS